MLLKYISDRQEERNRHRLAYEKFQKFYLTRAQRVTLRQQAAACWELVEDANVIEACVDVFIECMQARAHSIIPATLVRSLHCACLLLQDPAAGLDDQTKKVAIEVLERTITQLQSMLLQYLPLRFLGMPQTVLLANYSILTLLGLRARAPPCAEALLKGCDLRRVPA